MNNGKITKKRRKSKLNRFTTDNKTIKKSRKANNLLVGSGFFSRDKCDVPDVSKIEKQIYKMNTTFEVFKERLTDTNRNLEDSLLSIRGLYGQSLQNMRKEFSYEKQIEEYDLNLKNSTENTMDKAKLILLETQINKIKNTKTLINQKIKYNQKKLIEHVKNSKKGLLNF